MEVEFIVDIPSSLELEETERLFKQMKNGDVFACEKLINHHIRFVMFLVNSKFYKHDKE